MTNEYAKKDINFTVDFKNQNQTVICFFTNFKYFFYFQCFATCVCPF